jgi:hypothetical protein
MTEERRRSPRISVDMARIPGDIEYLMVLGAALQFYSLIDVALRPYVEVLKITFFAGDSSAAIEIVFHPPERDKFSVAVVYYHDTSEPFVVMESVESRTIWGRIDQREDVTLETQLVNALLEAGRVAAAVRIDALREDAEAVRQLRVGFAGETETRMIVTNPAVLSSGQRT